MFCDKLFFRNYLSLKRYKLSITLLVIFSFLFSCNLELTPNPQTIPTHVWSFYALILKEVNISTLTYVGLGKSAYLLEYKGDLSPFSKYDTSIKDSFEMQVIDTKKELPALKNKIIFYTYYSKIPGLYSYNPDDKKINLLFPYPKEIIFPDVAPDGKTILFSQKNDKGKFELYTIKSNGNELARIVDDDSKNVFFGNWSPDGNEIVYSSYNNNSKDSQIFVINVKEKYSKKLTSNPDYSFYRPKWSPDGKKLVFWSKSVNSNKETLWLMNIDGTELTQITDEENVNNFPEWSASGDKIYYITFKENYGRIINEISLKNKNQNVLMKTNSETGFLISPDGSKFAVNYQYYRDASHDVSPVDIYLYNIDLNNNSADVSGAYYLYFTWSKY